MNPAPIPIVRNSSGMEMPNGADGGNHMYNGNGTTASNSSTSFNHKRKRKLLDDCNVRTNTHIKTPPNYLPSMHMLTH